MQGVYQFRFTPSVQIIRLYRMCLHVPVHDICIAWKACALRDIPKDLPCSANPDNLLFFSTFLCSRSPGAVRLSVSVTGEQLVPVHCRLGRHLQRIGQYICYVSCCRIGKVPSQPASIHKRICCKTKAYLTWLKEESNRPTLEVVWEEQFLVKVLSRPKCNLVPSGLVRLKLSLQTSANKIVFVAPTTRCISKLYLTRGALSKRPLRTPPPFFKFPLTKSLTTCLETRPFERPGVSFRLFFSLPSSYDLRQLKHLLVYSVCNISM